MSPVQQTVNVTSATGTAVHLLITEGDVKAMAESPEQAMEEIEVRATQVSAVLEGIFLEPHGHPQWGLNE